MTSKRITTLALDLEGTLVSNAASQLPRPGLFQFLEECQVLFDRLVAFTSISETRFRDVADSLVRYGDAPAWYRDIEYVDWFGGTKDLSFIRGAEIENCLLVDDQPSVIHPGQESQWIEIPEFDYPYPDTDRVLFEILGRLRQEVRRE